MEYVVVPDSARWPQGRTERGAEMRVPGKARESGAGVDRESDR